MNNNQTSQPHTMAKPLNINNHMAQPYGENHMAQPYGENHMAQPYGDNHMAQPYGATLLILLLLVGYLTASGQDIPMQERLMQHVSTLAADSMQGRGLGTEGKYRARQYIEEQFREAGLQTFKDMEDYLQPFDTRIALAWVSAYNVVGFLQGSDPDLNTEYVVIGAHYDHLGYQRRRDGGKTIFPGADDNASGVAGIIEIARYFSANPTQLKRSLIVVAFDAEESGLLGARHFVDNPPVPVENIKLMFSFDMIGMYLANKGLHLLGIGSLQNGASAAQDIAESLNINLRRTGSNIERRTDTAPFGERGIPAVHVFTGSKSPYHKPTDTYDLLDYEGMATVVEYATALISNLAGQHVLAPTQALATQAARIEKGGSYKMVFGLSSHTGAGYHRYEDTFYRASSMLNFSTGFFTNIPVGRFMAIQPEVLYDFNGSKIADGNFRRHSLTVPVNVQLGTPWASQGNARAFIVAGPYYRYNLAGRSVKVKMDFADDFARDEWGYQLGIGIQLFNFQLGYTMRKALTGIMQASNTGMYENNSFIFDNNSLFSIGIGF